MLDDPTRHRKNMRYFRVIFIPRKVGYCPEHCRQEHLGSRRLIEVRMGAAAPHAPHRAGKLSLCSATADGTLVHHSLG